MSLLAELHKEAPEKKLTAEWCNKVTDLYYHNTDKGHLLRGKNIKEIDSYAEGNYPMHPFKKMMKQERLEQLKNNRTGESLFGDYTKKLDYKPLAMLSNKINSVIALNQKTKFEFSLDAQDPLAADKKKNDLDFLRYYNELVQLGQEINDELGLGKFEAGTTKNNTTPFAFMPLDLDINDSDDFQIMTDLVYKLKSESAFESLLMQLSELKKISDLTRLDTRDQIRYGVSCNRAFCSAITQMPDCEYIHPSSIICSPSDYPDFRDNDFRHLYLLKTPQEVMNYFDVPKEEFDRMLNGDGSLDNNHFINKNSYVKRNNIDGKIEPSQYDFRKIELFYTEVKTIDNLGIKKGVKYDAYAEEDEQPDYYITSGNTIGYYWLSNTRHVLGIVKLGNAYRSKGNESYSGFSTNIYKTMEESPVEKCIGLINTATIADLKFQNALLKARESGVFIDVKYLYRAAETLEGGVGSEVIKEILAKYENDTILIGSSDGINEPNGGQYKPITDIKGGIDPNVIQYLNIIQSCTNRISEVIGINDAVTGQNISQDQLVGTYKLKVNSSINALSYIPEAKINNFEKLFNCWCYWIKWGIENSPEAKKAYINMIGSQKVDIIDGLDELPLHEFGFKLSLENDELTQQDFDATLQGLASKGAISVTDIFLIKRINNRKDAYSLLAIKEKKAKKEARESQQMQLQSMQQVEAMRGETKLKAIQMQGQNEIAVQQTKGEILKQVTQLTAQLGIGKEQTVGMIRGALQKQRSDLKYAEKIGTAQLEFQQKQTESLI